MTASIEEYRDDMLDEVLYTLDRYGECLAVKPYGTGKTCLEAKLIDMYDRVLVLYINKSLYETIRDAYWIVSALNPNTKASLDHVDFVTYQKLALSGIDADPTEYDLVICDEADATGAKETSKALIELFENLRPNAHTFGATATPNRMDGVDWAAHFGHKSISPLMLEEAFEAGYLLRPYYCVCDYELLSPKNVELPMESALSASGAPSEIYKAAVIERARLDAMPNVFRMVCDAYAPTTDYMKFIVFYTRISKIDENRHNIIRWFQEAYPNHEINTLEVTSRNKDTEANVKELASLTPRSQTIDLIFAVNMMTFGYHADDLTGIVMYRGTSSSRCFGQQFGRVLSSSATHPGIVFDLVQNIYRHAVFDMFTEKKTDPKRMRMHSLIALYHLMPQVMTDAQKDEMYALCAEFKVDPDAPQYAKGISCVHDVVNFLTTYDMVSAEQLQLKLDAEPLSFKCRQVYNLWLKYGGKDSPSATMEDILRQIPPEYVPIATFIASEGLAPYDVARAINKKSNMTASELQALADEMAAASLATDPVSIYDGDDDDEPEDPTDDDGKQAID